LSHDAIVRHSRSPRQIRQFNPVSADWRYTLIRPDGRVLGTTNGEGSASVYYCISCHLAREANDHLYFVPPHARP
jgi:hypothetical protein